MMQNHMHAAAVCECVHNIPLLQAARHQPGAGVPAAEFHLYFDSFLQDIMCK